LNVKYGPIMKQILRAGNKWYRDIQIPENVKTFVVKSGQECYVSGIGLDDKVIIYVFELKKFIEKNYLEVAKYLK
jgi:hypothetical protein